MGLKAAASINRTKSKNLVRKGTSQIIKAKSSPNKKRKAGSQPQPITRKTNI